MATINRFDSLLGVLRDMAYSPAPDHEVFAETSMQGLMKNVASELIAEAPEGSVERDFYAPSGALISHGRPSERIWGEGNTLARSIDREPTIRRSGRTVHAAVIIDHPSYDEYEFGIFEWVTKGTEAHRIPESGFANLVFWWGNPLRWEPSDSSLAGPNFWEYVNHPGAEPIPFQRGPIDDAKKQIPDILRRSFLSSLAHGVGRLRFMRRGT